MALEIERKFLVKQKFVWDDELKNLPHEYITQGYFLDSSGKTVRVRYVGSSGNKYIGVLTLKSKINDVIRNEFEYEIPGSDAKELLKLCKKGVTKVRYFYKHGCSEWTVDIFKG